MGPGAALLRPDAVRSFADADVVLFVGIDTAGSAVHREFPGWAPALGLGGAVLRGVDLPASTPPASWRALLADLAANPRVRGAVVTSHKLRLFAACAELFAATDLAAFLMQEASTLAVRPDGIHAYARDVVALDGELRSGLPGLPGPAAEVVCLGCGGAATALLLALALDVDALLDGRVARRERRPVLTFADVDGDAVRGLGAVAARIGLGPDDVRVVRLGDGTGADARRLVEGAAPGSLVVNATGLGKLSDASPLPDGTRFPAGALAWDFNYRGPLTFLAQAREQGAATVDGRSYYLAGWAGALAAIASLDPREARTTLRAVAGAPPASGAGRAS